MLLNIMGGLFFGALFVLGCFLAGLFYTYGKMTAYQLFNVTPRIGDR